MALHHLDASTGNRETVLFCFGCFGEIVNNNKELSAIHDVLVGEYRCPFSAKGCGTVVEIS